MCWALRDVAPSPPPPGAHRAPCWRAYIEPPGDMPLPRLLRLLYGHLCEGRTVEQVLELDAALAGNAEEVAELEWERVRRDQNASPDDRVRARLRLMEAQREARQAAAGAALGAPQPAGAPPAPATPGGPRGRRG